MTTEYERQREEKIAENKRRLQELGLQGAAESLAAEAGPPAKKKQRTEKKARRESGSEAEGREPPRRSARARREVSYAEPSMQEVLARAPAVEEREPLPAYSPPDSCAAPVVPSFDAGEGVRDAQGRLVFPGFPDFRPNLTPKQVIRAGSFGGIYFNPAGGKRGIKGKSVAIDPKEFPQDWFAGLPKKAYAARIYTVGTNKYGVKAGQDQAFWESKGWIHEQDPRGWFQWYCRFFEGRRSEDDARQISRWKGVVGDKGRWVRALVNKIVRSQARWDDSSISPVIRQTLLHWAFELTEEEFSRMRSQI